MSVTGRSVPTTGQRSHHTVRNVLKSGHWRDPEVLRFFLVSSQCRGAINYSLVQIEQADTASGQL